jgi:hypothetical protein
MGQKHILQDTIAGGELGFASIYVSEESGGIGLGRLEAALIGRPWPMAALDQRAFI